jgi:hypothetical protein
VCGGGQPGQVEHQRGGERGVAAVPGELHPHRRAEEAAERDEVPGGLEVTDVVDVLDAGVALWLVAERLAQDPLLARRLGRVGARVGEVCAVAAAEQVGAGPGAHPQVSHREHRRQYRLDQRLAGLAVMPGVRDRVAVRERVERGQAGTCRWGEIDV